tara:strand:- start:1369 stop:1605 length:237 start_codon:yes stop_codon:yes gene_type:complete
MGKTYRRTEYAPKWADAFEDYHRDTNKWDPEPWRKAKKEETNRRRRSDTKRQINGDAEEIEDVVSLEKKYKGFINHYS